MSRFPKWDEGLCGKVGTVRGIAPSAGIVLAFNIWLVLTSAVKWIVVGLVVRLFACGHDPANELNRDVTPPGALSQPKPQKEVRETSIFNLQTSNQPTTRQLGALNFATIAVMSSCCS